MTDNVEAVTLEILKSIRGTIAEFRAEATQRFDQIELAIRKERRNSAGTLVMMRATAGDFDERVSALEARVKVLEERLP